MNVNTMVLLIGFFLSLLASLPPQAPTEGTVPGPVFRAPFTVTIQVDQGHYSEERFEKVPYVADNDIHLFAGEQFGINVTLTGDEISGVSYQPNLAKADVEVRFSQQKQGRVTMMVLDIKSKLKRPLFVDALMMVPGKKETYRTSIFPVQPGQSSSEMWPTPIVQLILRNLRFKDAHKNVDMDRKP